MGNREVLRRELAHHEELYAGFAQAHFARPAVRAFRRHLTRRILKATGAGAESRMLSLGCGIGDTELMLAPVVGRITGIDLSPSAIRQARSDAAAAGAENVDFREGDLEALDFEPRSFDSIIGVFFMHHLDDGDLRGLAGQVRELLKPGGVFYALDPSRYRLSGFIGKLLIPHLMARHQSPDERELAASEVAAIFLGGTPHDLMSAPTQHENAYAGAPPAEGSGCFQESGLEVWTGIYDFISTPVAGLFPGSAALYRGSRIVDELLIRIPLLRLLGSNFELIARRASSD